MTDEKKYSEDEKFSLRDLVKIIFYEDTQNIVKALMHENLYEYKEQIVAAMQSIDYEQLNNMIKSELTQYVVKNVVPLLQNILEQQSKTQEMLKILNMLQADLKAQKEEKKKGWF